MAAKDISYEAIVRSVKAGDIKPAYVLMGAEPYYIDKLLNAIIEKALPEEDRDFCLNTFYGADTTANAIVNAARSFPMGERLVVLVKNANEIKNLEEISFYLQNPQATTVLILVNKNGTFDRRKKFMAQIAQMGVIFESQKLKDYQLPPLVSAYFKQKGYAIDNKSVALIADSIGADLTRLYGEMKKLVDALPEGTKAISPALVEKYIGISKDFNVFEFQDALIHKDSVRAFRIAKYFDDNPKQNPIQVILPSLFRVFSQLMTAYYAPAKDKASLARYLGVQDWQVDKNILPAMRLYSAGKVFAILAEIRATDEKSKGIGGSKTSTGDLLKQLIFFILN